MSKLTDGRAVRRKGQLAVEGGDATRTKGLKCVIFCAVSRLLGPDDAVLSSGARSLPESISKKAR